MTNDRTIQFTFALDDPELDDNRRQKIAGNLLRELRDLDEVEKAYLSEDIYPEPGSKPGFATLIGFITAKVNIQKNKGFFQAPIQRPDCQSAIRM
jgi:hypothetical protein